MNCPELEAFAQRPQVRKAAGLKAYKAWVKNLGFCQYEEFDETGCPLNSFDVECAQRGLVSLCWHHAKEAREGLLDNAKLAVAARDNWYLFLCEEIRQTLLKPRDSEISFAELVLWAMLKNCLHELPEKRLCDLFRLPLVDWRKESTVGMENQSAYHKLGELAGQIRKNKTAP